MCIEYTLEPENHILFISHSQTCVSCILENRYLIKKYVTRKITFFSRSTRVLINVQLTFGWGQTSMIYVFDLLLQYSWSLPLTLHNVHTVYHSNLYISSPGKTKHCLFIKIESDCISKHAEADAFFDFRYYGIL